MRLRILGVLGAVLVLAGIGLALVPVAITVRAPAVSGGLDPWFDASDRPISCGSVVIPHRPDVPDLKSPETEAKYETRCGQQRHHRLKIVLEVGAPGAAILAAAAAGAMGRRRRTHPEPAPGVSLA